MTNKISDTITEELVKMKSINLITEKNFDYLNIQDPKEARLYLLPKIHKRTYLGDPFVVPLTIPLQTLANL